MEVSAKGYGDIAVKLHEEEDRDEETNRVKNQ